MPDSDKREEMYQKAESVAARPGQRQKCKVQENGKILERNALMRVTLSGELVGYITDTGYRSPARYVPLADVVEHPEWTASSIDYDDLKSAYAPPIAPFVACWVDDEGTVRPAATANTMDEVIAAAKNAIPSREAVVNDHWFPHALPGKMPVAVQCYNWSFGTYNFLWECKLSEL